MSKPFQAGCGYFSGIAIHGGHMRLFQLAANQKGATPSGMAPF
jgi:hypothetical protein